MAALDTLDTALLFILSLTAAAAPRAPTCLAQGSRNAAGSRPARRLQPVLSRLGAIHTQLQDTWLLAGADAMQKATSVYPVLKNTRGQGLDHTLNVLKQRFVKNSPAAPEEPAEP